MREHAVVVVGGGPAGMVLAAELTLAGADVAVVERRPKPALVGSRAGGFHSRTIEIFDQRGIADRFLAVGQVAQTARFADVVLDISDFPTRHPYGLGLWQNRIEQILNGWLDDLGVCVYRGREVTGLAQDGTGVTIDLSAGESMRGEYVVGADGGRSLVRRASGIAFPGADATRSQLIGEVELREEPGWGMRTDETGVHSLGRVDYEIRDGQVVYADHGPVRVMVTEEHVGATTEPTLDDLRTALTRVYGSDFGAHDPTWLSRFSDATRQAATYRDRRVLMIGDAAHIHSPAGGQGIGLGVQDAMNLGWKLGRVVRGTSPDSLLDTYHDERHPADARALQHTMAQSVIQGPDKRVSALRDLTAELLTTHEARVRTAALIHGLDVRYDLGQGHPLLGRRMPDLDIVTTSGPTHVYALLRHARPLLLTFAGSAPNIAPWTDIVTALDVAYDGPWELPVLGAVQAPRAVLIRPDGHVAWAGNTDSNDALNGALTTWFGAAA